jgi:pyruvate-formate lyase-activating enzyme
VRLSIRGRERGKQVAVHTHFNHPKEFTWVSREAAQKLFMEGVVVRNQSVLLRGVNDNLETMSALIRELADDNIQPASPARLYPPHSLLTWNSTTYTNVTWSQASKISVPRFKLS